MAVVQVNSGDDISQNLKQINEYLRLAVAKQSVAVFLPECFAFMQSSRDQLFQFAERDAGGQIQDFLSSASARYGIWIFAGSLPFRTSDPGRITNTMLVFNQDGNRVARYDKIHLFDVVLSVEEKYLESSYTQPGEEIKVVDTPFGKVGLSICYDLRFPEMYRKLVGLGAEILIVPSAFSNTTGEAHWLPLLQARAIENTCYVVAPAQTGVHPNGRKPHGRSVIIDPWGRVLGNMKEECGLLTADIDLPYLSRIRSSLPSLSHRRPELF